MALPPAIQTVQVNFGPFIDFQGQPLKGSTTFEPSVPVRHEATGTPILNRPITIEWDLNGTGAVILPATDSTGLNVTGFTYRVTHRTYDSGVPSPLGANIVLPAAAPNVDLDMLLPTTASNGIVVDQPAVTSVAGMAGAVTAEALAAALDVGVDDVDVAALVADAGSDTAAQLRAAFTAPVLGGTFVAAGDSLTAADSSTTLEGNSWASVMVGASKGRLRLIRNVAVAGRTSAQILAAFDSEVIALAPKSVGVMAGTNDAGTAVPLATTQANIKAIVAKLRTAGIAFFLCTIPPRGMAAITVPSAPVGTASGSGGTLAAGTYSYTYTAVTQAGESLPSPAASVVTTGSTSSVTLVAPVVDGVIGYNFYRNNTRIGSNVGIFSGDRQFVDTGAAGGVAAPTTDSSADAGTSDIRTATKAINSWLRAYCEAQRIRLVDHHALLVDPATGMMKTGVSVGGLHLSGAAQATLGQAAWDTLAPSVRPTASLGPAQDNTDPANAYSNGLFLAGTTGPGGIPTGWTGYDSPTTTLGTKTGFIGNAFTVERTAVGSGTPRASFTLSSGYTEGDIIRVAMVVQTEGAKAGGAECYVQVRTFWNITRAQRNISLADVGPHWFITPDFPMQTGTDGITFEFGLYRGTGKVTIGQIAVYNLTTKTWLLGA